MFDFLSSSHRRSLAASGLVDKLKSLLSNSDMCVVCGSGVWRRFFLCMLSDGFTRFCAKSCHSHTSYTRTRSIACVRDEGR